NTFDIIAVDSLVDIAVMVRTFTNQFSINPLDPNSPNFSVTNPDQVIGQLFFSDPALNSGFKLHSVPAANRIAGYRIGMDQSAVYSIRLWSWPTSLRLARCNGHY